jgi:hypothetical protein
VKLFICQKPRTLRPAIHVSCPVNHRFCSFVCSFFQSYFVLNPVGHYSGHDMNLTVQDLPKRSDFYRVNLGSLGRPLSSAVPPSLRDNFSTPRCQAEGGMGWIWCQWLLEAPAQQIQKEIAFLVNRGMQLQKKMSGPLRYRALHDLWLLHCAIFASTDKQLRQLAEDVVDSSGIGGQPLRTDGEFHASAWCGMLKHWILGDHVTAAKEASLIWTAYRYNIARFAPKSLVTKWLAADWNAFRTQQEKDFNALWEGARKKRLINSKKSGSTIVDAWNIPVAGHGWCWAHCGLAVLAHRQGIPVTTDPFWFPPHALKCVPNSPH